MAQISGAREGGMGLTIKLHCRWLLSVGALDVSSVVYEIVFTGSTTKELKWWTNSFRDNGPNNWQICNFFYENLNKKKNFYPCVM